MITLTVTFDVDPTRAEDFKEISLRHASNTLNLEEGCLQFSVCVNPAEPHIFYFFEAYADRYALDGIHKVSAHLAKFRADTAPLIRAVDRKEWDCLNPGTEKAFGK